MPFASPTSPAGRSFITAVASLTSKRLPAIHIPACQIRTAHPEKRLALTEIGLDSWSVFVAEQDGKAVVVP
jgi:hypothetical protein